MRFGSLGQDLLQNSARAIVSDRVALAVVEEGKFLVIDSKQTEDGCLVIVGSHPIDHSRVAELVGFTIGHAPFDSAAGQPATEALAVVIAAGFSRVAMVLGHR